MAHGSQDVYSSCTGNAGASSVKDATRGLRHHECHHLSVQRAVVQTDDAVHSNCDQPARWRFEDRRAEWPSSCPLDILARDGDREAHPLLVGRIRLLPVDHRVYPVRVLDMDNRVRRVAFHRGERCGEAAACGRLQKPLATVADGIAGIYWTKTGVPRGIQAVSSDGDARLRKSLIT